MGLFRKKEPAGVPALAAVVMYGWGREAGQQAPDANTTSNTKADVRVVDPPGNDAVQTVKGMLPGLVRYFLAEGDRIPVLIDPETGTVLGFDKPAITAKYEPRLGELKEAQKRESSFRYQAGLEKEQLDDLKQLPGDLADAARGLKDSLKESFQEPAADGGLAATDPLLAPIDNVDFDMWVAVRAGLVRERVKKKEHDTYATSAGVPAGQWTAIDKAWFSRMNGSPGLAQKFGVAYQQAVKGG